MSTSPSIPGPDAEGLPPVEAARLARERSRIGQEKLERRKQLQRQASFQLIAAGLIFAGLTILAAWLIVVPRGKLTAKAVQPVLEAYLTAGANNAPFAAHRLYSRAGLAAISPEDVMRAFEDRAAFDGYAALTLSGFEVVPLPAGEVDYQANVTGTVTYAGRDARGKLVAQLELEGDTWRIRDIFVYGTAADAGSVAP